MIWRTIDEALGPPGRYCKGSIARAVLEGAVKRKADLRNQEEKKRGENEQLHPLR